MNLATILVLAALVAVLAAIVASRFLRKKKGGCSCGCEGCAMKDACRR